jgi:uncharacterized protein (TIGR00297 family)
VRGLKKKSLSTDGAIAAFITGLIHCFAGYDFTFVLATFFFSSSFWTKYKSEIKHKLEADFKEGGQRNTWQVLANSSTASIVCILYLWMVGTEQLKVDFGATGSKAASILISILIGHYACCNGDTWASELGILSKGDPYLITTGRRVPKGTNGGISVWGTFASVAAGFTIGIVYYLGSLPFAIGSHAPPQWPVIILATIAGALGSIIDSILGATLQYSSIDPKSGLFISHPVKGDKHITGIHLLNNHVVNYLSSILTSLLCAAIAPYLF